MTDKHTPEPWIVDYDCGDTFINSFDGEPIAMIDRNNANKRGNATLIAKAPEILAENEAMKKRIAELEADNASLREHLEEIQKENDGLVDQVDELELTLPGGKG